MKRLLTKANGYERTDYIFLNFYFGNRRIFKKDNRFYIEQNQKIYDVTDKKEHFYRSKNV